MSDLLVRPRRLRFNPRLRDLVAEARLDPRMFVMPHFVLRKPGEVQEIDAMPGIRREGVDALLRRPSRRTSSSASARCCCSAFPTTPSRSTRDGRAAYGERRPGAAGRRALKKRFGDDLVVMTDVCLCAYTDHGHCGVIEDGRVANDASLEHLARMARRPRRAPAPTSSRRRT